MRCKTKGVHEALVTEGEHALVQEALGDGPLGQVECFCSAVVMLSPKTVRKTLPHAKSGGTEGRESVSLLSGHEANIACPCHARRRGHQGADPCSWLERATARGTAGDTRRGQVGSWSGAPLSRMSPRMAERSGGC